MTVSPDEYKVVAHRGNAAEFPENSIAALRSAVALGVQWLEIDVQIAADGVPMMLHDDSLQRVTGASGAPWDFSAIDLTRLRLANGDGVATLAEVAGWLADCGDVRLFVELKRASLARFGSERMLAACLAALAPALHRCVLISFDASVLDIARRWRSLPIGWVLPAYGAAERQIANRLAPQFLFVDIQKIPGAEPLWGGPWEWCVYEVPDPDLALACRARGARFIETMQVRKLQAAGGV